MKNSYSQIIALFLCIAFSIPQSFATGNNKKDKKNERTASTTLDISCTVINDDGVLSNAVVELYENNEVILTSHTDEKGRTDMQLPFNSNFAIRIVNEGYYDKLVYFNTSDVESVKLPDFVFEAYMFPIESYESIPEADILDFPAGLVYYSEKYDGFIYDKGYSKKIRSEYRTLMRIHDDQEYAEVYEQQ